MANPEETRTVANKIAALLPASRPILKSEILRTYDSIFDWRGGMMVAILAMAVLAFVIFAWDKATGLSAEERREMGILKSIGWETADILLLKFWEGIAISLTAFLLGILIAYCHVYFFSAGLFAGALKGWSVLYPDFQPAPGHQPVPDCRHLLSDGFPLYRCHYHPVMACRHHRSRYGNEVMR